MQSALKTIFDNPKDLELIKSEILRLPEETFTEFLELYGRLTEELKQIEERKDEDIDYNIE